MHQLVRLEFLCLRRSNWFLCSVSNFGRSKTTLSKTSCRRYCSKNMDHQSEKSKAAAVSIGLQQKKPHLVLHFDVNKTILLCDPVSGMDVLGMLQSAISECSWGTLVKAEGDDEVETWQLTYTKPAFVAPQAGLVTYSDFLEYGRFKLVENSDKDPKVAAMNKQNKKEKKTFKKVFTEPGQPGEMMRPLFDQMVEKLRIPNNLREVCHNHQLKNLHGDFAFVLPSFYQSLNMLQKEGRSFSVIFRTFGTETHEVKEGFNTFRKGQHPFAPNVHNTLPRYHSGIIKFPHQMGCFKRSDGRTQLLIGTIDNRNSKSSDGPLKVIEGSREIHTFLQSQSLEGINYALRDDYLYWASKAEASEAGKLLLVDPADESCHHIFFDDNVERTHAHIVDCRDVSNNDAPINFEDALNKWMVKAEPVQALLDPLYFYKKIIECEANVAADRKSNP